MTPASGERASAEGVCTVLCAGKKEGAKGITGRSAGREEDGATGCLSGTGFLFRASGILQMCGGFDEDGATGCPEICAGLDEDEALGTQVPRLISPQENHEK